MKKLILAGVSPAPSFLAEARLERGVALPKVDDDLNGRVITQRRVPLYGFSQDAP